MKLINIAFDLDGTLIDIIPTFKKVLWEKYKAKVPKYEGFKIKTNPHLEYDKIKECFLEAFKRIDDIKIFPEAQEFLHKLYKLADGNDPIRIVTARPLTSANDTYKICEKICKGIDFEVVIVEDSDNKIKYLNRYDYYVDDRRKTALHLTSFGKKVYMLKKEYNQPLPENHNVYQITSMKQLLPVAKFFIK